MFLPDAKFADGFTFLLSKNTHAFCKKKQTPLIQKLTKSYFKTSSIEINCRDVCFISIDIKATKEQLLNHFRQIRFIGLSTGDNVENWPKMF